MNLPEPEAVASQVLDLTGQRDPPTNVRAMLKKWSKLAIVETQLDGDGFFVDLGEAGGEIFLRKDKSENRKRFTLAHELGHFLLRCHLREKVETDKIERWCNRFAAELLLPSSMLSIYLRSGGIRNLTQKLLDGPKLFEVSEQAFYLRISRLFPASIFRIMVSGSSISVLDVFTSKELQKNLGGGDLVLEPEVQAFVVELAQAGVSQQCQYKQFDRIWLARKSWSTGPSKKFILAVFER